VRCRPFLALPRCRLTCCCFPADCLELELA
jgi:hypothetical protein